jgi:hypothetical protein
MADTSLRPNSSGLPKNQLLGRLLLRDNPLKATVKLLTPKQFRYNLGQRISQRLLEKPSLSEETYAKLLGAYREDISSLQDLVGLDLTAWSEGQPSTPAR